MGDTVRALVYYVSIDSVPGTEVPQVRGYPFYFLIYLRILNSQFSSHEFFISRLNGFRQDIPPTLRSSVLPCEEYPLL